MLIQGGAKLIDNAGSAGVWITGFLLMVAGASLLAGFLTPFAATLAGVGVVAGWISVIPPTIFHSKPVVVFLLAVTVAILLVGPGAFSIDARLFGLREIIIPRSPKTD